MLHTLEAKLESLSCTCGAAFVKDGHKNLHGNATIVPSKSGANVHVIVSGCA
jgi:hypothetical protein